jgi:hypothetical protein
VAIDTGCKWDVADFTIKTFPILAQGTSVFESTLRSLCPGITIKTTNAQATDVGTKIPGYVTTAVQSDPNIKVVAFAFGAMTLGVPAALKAAGLSAQLVGYGADTPTNVQAVNVGQEAAEIGFGLPYGGWRAQATGAGGGTILRRERLTAIPGATAEGNPGWCDVIDMIWFAGAEGALAYLASSVPDDEDWRLAAVGQVLGRRIATEVWVVGGAAGPRAYQT